MNESEYVYLVRSNKPLHLAVGIGNMPVIQHPEWGVGLVQIGHSMYAESTGAAASVNHRMTMELMGARIAEQEPTIEIKVATGGVSQDVVARAVAARITYDRDHSQVTAWLDAENALTDPQFNEYQERYRRGRAQ